MEGPVVLFRGQPVSDFELCFICASRRNFRQCLEQRLLHYFSSTSSNTSPPTSRIANKILHAGNRLCKVKNRTVRPKARGERHDERGRCAVLRYDGQKAKLRLRTKVMRAYGGMRSTDSDKTVLNATATYTVANSLNSSTRYTRHLFEHTLRR